MNYTPYIFGAIFFFGLLLMAFGLLGLKRMPQRPFSVWYAVAGFVVACSVGLFGP